MAGFFSPGLGFASGVGAFIGGAAQEGNRLLNEQRAQDRQDDILWMNKFERGLSEYNKEKKNSDLMNQNFSALLDAAGGDQRRAHAAMLQVMNDPKSFNTVFNQLMSDPNRGKNIDTSYQSTLPQTFSQGAQNQYQNLQNIYSSVGPNARKFMQMPDQGYSQTQSGQTQMVPQGQPSGGTDQLTNPPSQMPGAQLAASGQTPGSSYNVTPSFTLGSTNKLATHEILKPDQFVDAQAYQKYITSVNQNPNDPSKWDFSGASASKQGRLDPVIQGQIMEANKNLQYMTPEDRAAWAASVQEAQRTGDVSKLRMDLVPSADTINQQQANKATLAKVGVDYANSLQKRADNMPIMNKSANAAGQILSKVMSGDVNASAWQPFFDSITRGAAAAGVDLRGMGFPGNKIEDINQFKKFLADLTFDQIPNYHLGRWTNREFSLLQDSLPSLDTDPSTMAKVALLFRRAALREMQLVPQEREQLAKDRGDPTNAIRLNSSMLSDTSLPWMELDPSADAQTNRATVNAMRPGTWFEAGGRMGYKMPDGSVRMMNK